jgi:hypothetical protein
MNLKKILYESFDRGLTKNEALKLSDALKKSTGLARERNDIKNIRDAVSGSARTAFSPGFEIEVLRKINSQSLKGSDQYILFTSLNSAFRKLAYATIIFIIITLSYNFGKSGNISLKSALGIKQQNSSLADEFKNLFSFYE